MAPSPCSNGPLSPKFPHDTGEPRQPHYVAVRLVSKAQAYSGNLKQEGLNLVKNILNQSQIGSRLASFVYVSDSTCVRDAKTNLK